MSFLPTPWSGRRYFLDKMPLRDLVWAYVTYPAIQIYALLSGLVPGAPVLRRGRQE